MELVVERYRLLVVPENPTDEAYLEEVLGLRRGGDSCLLCRVDAMGLSCWAYAQTDNSARGHCDGLCDSGGEGK